RDGGAGGTVELTGTRIDLGGNVDTSGGSGAGGGALGAGGDALFHSDVKLLGTRAITTGATAGNISFEGKLDGSTAFTEGLTLTAGAGDVTFGGMAGTGSPLGAVVVNSARNLTFNDSFSGRSLTQTAGTGTTLLSRDAATTPTVSTS